jgi:NADPH:quinone reductase-like Zn-dependent oxidoreductase
MMTTVMKPMSGHSVEDVDRQTMKAVYLTTKGGAESLVVGEIPQPRPKEGEVLVEVHATTVMPTEFQWFTTFNLPFGKPRAFPVVLSDEFLGTVESIYHPVSVSYFDARSLRQD